MGHRKLYCRQVLQPSMIKDESNKHIPDITWFLQVWYFWFCGNSAIIENISPATRLWYDPGQGRQIGEILLPWSNLVGESKKWKVQGDICRKISALFRSLWLLEELETQLQTMLPWIRQRSYTRQIQALGPPPGLTAPGFQGPWALLVLLHWITSYFWQEAWMNKRLTKTR